ncbi:MAG: ABC transporter permease [Haloarculaceae archaeon]
MVNTLYLAKRIVVSIISVIAIASIVFGMTAAIPGSAATIVLGTQRTEEAMHQLEQQMGLTRPLYERYIDFVLHTFTFDWGTSLISGQPVSKLVVPAFFRTLELALVATIISIIIAIPLGVLTAAKRDSIFDTVSLNLSYVAISIPSFVSATLLLLFLTTPPLNLFPNGGYVPLSENPIGWLYHLILPAISINFVIFAYVLRQTRSSMIETLEADFIRTARLKGVAESNVLARHALRNGLLPTITVLAINFGWMMGSVVIIEEIFSYPGIGRVIVRAISSRDLPVIQAAILVPTMAFILANLVADLLYTVLDPRIELGEK